MSKSGNEKEEDVSEEDVWEEDVWEKDRGYDLLRYWSGGIHQLHRLHLEASIHFNHFARLLGLPVVILTTIVGTAVFTAISSPGETSLILQIVAGTLSIIATVFAALQTFLNYPEQAERHHEAAIKFHTLSRGIEQILEFRKYTPDEFEKIVSKLNTEWKALDEKSPSIPHKFWKELQKEEERRRLEEKTLTQGEPDIDLEKEN